MFVTNTRKLKIIFMFYTIYLLKNKPFTNFNLDKTLILNSQTLIKNAKTQPRKIYILKRYALKQTIKLQLKIFSQFFLFCININLSN